MVTFFLGYSELSRGPLLTLMPKIQFSFPPEITIWLLGAFWAAVALLHILFMVCLWNDAQRLREQGRPTGVLSPFVWGFAALLLGLVVVAFYWLVHYSRFARQPQFSLRR